MGTPNTIDDVTVESESSEETQDSDEWISPDTESNDLVRIAELEDFEDDVASFVIGDVQLDSVGEYRRTPVTEGYNSVDQIPDRYSRNTIFRVVPSDEGEFTISSYEHFTGREDGEQYTIGLQFDPDLNSRYQDIMEELVDS